jgi:LPXTG-motif cell wall-anchored protein
MTALLDCLPLIGAAVALAALVGLAWVRRKEKDV